MLSSPLSLPLLWCWSMEDPVGRKFSGEMGTCQSREPGPSVVHPCQPLIPQSLAWPPAWLPHPPLMGSDKGRTGRHGCLTLSSAWVYMPSRQVSVSHGLPCSVTVALHTCAHALLLLCTKALRAASPQCVLIIMGNAIPWVPTMCHEQCWHLEQHTLLMILQA